MKKLQLKILTAATLMGGSLLLSGGAMASVSGGTAVFTADVTAPGAACEAYSPSNDDKLSSHWNDAVASGSVWIHCPVTSILGTAGITLTQGLIYNVDLPNNNGSSSVYNCYLAAQSTTSTADSTRKVTWKTGSGVGPLPVEVLSPEVSAALPDMRTYTSGCLLNSGHRVHSIVTK